MRTLHPNLTFRLADMKSAIATSIRSARSELRKAERNRQQSNTSRIDDSCDLRDNDGSNDSTARDVEAEVDITDESDGEDDERDQHRDSEDDEENERDFTSSRVTYFSSGTSFFAIPRYDSATDVSLRVFRSF